MTGLLDTTVESVVTPGYLSNVTSVFAAAIDWLGDCVAIFTSHPVLFVPVALAIFAIMIAKVSQLVRGA